MLACLNVLQTGCPVWLTVDNQLLPRTEAATWFLSKESHLENVDFACSGFEIILACVVRPNAEIVSGQEEHHRPQQPAF